MEVIELMAKVEGCFMVVMVESLMDLSWRHPPPNRDGSKSGDLFNYDDHMFRNILFPCTLSSFSREFPKIYCRMANFAAVLLMGMVFSNAHGADNASLFSSHEKEVQALLLQMTLDEKIGQMVQVDSGALKQGDVTKFYLGSVLSGGSSDPAAGNSPQAWLDEVNGFKAEALQTRLKIPLIYGIDAVHGHNNIEGAVIFPHHIGMGATHDPELVKRAEQVTAAEVAGTGIRWAFAPCIAVPQDERWGRTYEGYSDQTELVAQLGAAAVKGLQGDQLSANPQEVLACAKHFIGDGGTHNGKDQGDTECDDATLRRLFLPPY